MIVQLDEPLADPAALNVLYISALARRHGVKVFLSGAAGDDIFSGYRRHQAVGLGRYWRRLPVRVRASLRRGSVGLQGFGTTGRRFARAFANADAEPERRLTSYFLWADSGRLQELLPLDIARP